MPRLLWPTTTVPIPSEMPSTAQTASMPSPQYARDASMRVDVPDVHVAVLTCLCSAPRMAQWSGSSFASDGRVVRSNNLDPAHLEESEVAQGLNILHAAEQTPSLSHFVLQSMHRGGNSEPRDPLAPAPLHHRAKWRQEEALHASSSLACAWSVLRQPTYLENFANDATAAAGTQLRKLQPGVVSGLLGMDEELTVIAVDDLGALAVAMLREGPEVHAGRTLAVGTERISGRTLAESASRAHGSCRFDYRPVPWWVVEFIIPVDYPKQLKRWLSTGGNDEGARANADEAVFAATRALYPETTSVEDWLIAQGVRELPVPASQRTSSSASHPQAPEVGVRTRRAIVGAAALAAVPAALASALGRVVLPPRPPSLAAASLLAANEPRGDGVRGVGRS